MIEPLVLTGPAGLTATLYCGDCLEVLPTLAPGSVDAVVTDPPYNVGFSYATHNDRMPNAEYLEWLRARFQAAANAGTVQLLWFWQGIRLANGEARAVLPNGFEVHHACAWHKREFAGDLMKHEHPAFCWEPIIWSASPGLARYGGSRGGVSGRDLITGNHSRHDGNFDHPCVKPLSVVKGVVGWVAAATVLDPFMGSGTTGVACAQTGRNFIGIEIDPGYFEIAVKRIRNALAQPRLL